MGKLKKEPLYLLLLCLRVNNNPRKTDGLMMQHITLVVTDSLVFGGLSYKFVPCVSMI